MRWARRLLPGTPHRAGPTGLVGLARPGGSGGTSPRASTARINVMTGRNQTRAEPRARARDLGVVPGPVPTGPLNAITDVPGIRVGHTTLIEGSDIRTGVTAIVPDGLARAPGLDAGLAVGNGYRKIV